MEDRKGRYQICGPNAFSRYGWDEQVPHRVYAYNNKISGERRIGRVALTLIKVADERLGATETFETPDGAQAVYCSRTRALMDAVYDWSRFDSLPRGYDWIRRELSKRDKTAKELVDVALEFGNVSTLRRLGKLLELEGVKESLLAKIKRAITPSSALIAWVPNYPKRGATDRRWGVICNDKR